VTSSGPPATFRYLSDGRLGDQLTRERLTRLRRPPFVVPVVILGLAFGLWAARSQSDPFWLLAFGIAYCLLFLAFLAVVFLVLVVPISVVGNRGWAARHFPAGTVTEVELGDDALLVWGAGGARTIPYSTVFLVKRAGALVRIQQRGHLVPMLLPATTLPDEAIEFVRTRARGAWPALAAPDEPAPTRKFVVPPGWASHVAVAHVSDYLPRSRFLVRLGAVALVAAVLAVLAGPVWLLAVPAYAAVICVGTYVQTRARFSAILPEGSVMTSRVYDDRLVTSNAGGVREIGFDDVERVQVRADLVLLELDSRPGVTLIARTLVPDDVIARMREHPLSPRDPAAG
jgi:hypothetical protein